MTEKCLQSTPHLTRRDRINSSMTLPLFTLLVLMTISAATANEGDCVDVLLNCADYPPSACLQPEMGPNKWAHTNCRKHCNLCGTPCYHRRTHYTYYRRDKWEYFTNKYDWVCHCADDTTGTYSCTTK